MIDDFFELLAYSNQLAKNNKSLKNENTQQFKLLLNLLVLIEENFHYSKKNYYIRLAKAFLDNKITADDFSDSFMDMYERINRELFKLRQQESLDLKNFLVKVPGRKLNDILMVLYSSCDNYELDPDEKTLKDQAQLLFLELQEE